MRILFLCFFVSVFFISCKSKSPKLIIKKSSVVTELGPGLVEDYYSDSIFVKTVGYYPDGRKRNYGYKLDSGNVKWVNFTYDSNGNISERWIKFSNDSIAQWTYSEDGQFIIGGFCPNRKE